MPKDQSSRRKFLQQIGKTGLIFAASPLAAMAAKEKAEERILRYDRNISANDKIRIGVIGLGIMGYNDVNTALKVPGVELVAGCDLYTGRLERAKEVYGKELFTTRDYREILNRNDIDAVIVATTDNWHARITKEALQKGKAVYCEKPMVHKISEGLGVVEAQRASNKTMQVGSQRVSSIVYTKARELYKAGEIGKLNMVNAIYDRQSALGAWQYTMPTDASPQTVIGISIRRGLAGCPSILKNSSGGAITAILEQALPAICLCTYYQALMLLPAPKVPLKYFPPASFLIGKTNGTFPTL
jgi:hypothetical protein